MLTHDQNYELKQFMSLSEINISQAEEYKESFDKHIMAFQAPLQAVIDSGRYPYNSTVLDEVKKCPEFADMPEDTLSHYVYMAQQYRSGKRLYDHIEATKIELSQQGFKPILEQDFKPGIKVQVYTERSSKKYITARLVVDAEGRLFWVEPRFTRRGFQAQIGDYVKFS